MLIDFTKLVYNSDNEKEETELPENFNRTEDIWVVVYKEDDQRIARVISHKYPIQQEIIESIQEEYNHIEPRTEGVYIISGSPWCTYDEWNGDYDAGFDINSEEVVYNSSKSLIECDVDEHQIIFLSFKGGDNEIIKANDEFWKLPDERFRSIYDFVVNYVAEKDGIYNLIIRPSGYGGKVSQRVATVKVLDIPVGEYRW